MSKKPIEESWLVFYRTKNGKLNNREVPTKSVMRQATMPDIKMEFDVTKEEALYAVSKRKNFKDFERDSKGEPIVKRLRYVYE